MIIIDANIIVHALVSGPYSEKARQIFEPEVKLAAPNILFGEVANALGKLLRTQLIKRPQAELLFDTFLGMPIILFDSYPLLENAFALTLDCNLGFFDCVYIETARRHSTRLLTVDEKLIKKFNGSNIDIIHLND